MSWPALGFWHGLLVGGVLGVLVSAVVGWIVMVAADRPDVEACLERGRGSAGGRS